MPRISPTLHMVCGKIASGKSTLTAELAKAPHTVRVSEDEWLGTLFSDQMTTIKDYALCSERLRACMAPHVASLLTAGVSVVLDFPANTVDTRAWMRTVLDQTEAADQLHFLDISDALCLQRLQRRNAEGTHPFQVTEAQFHQVSKHFQPPSDAEGFTIVRHTVTD